MAETPIKVSLDAETLARLRDLAASERRGASDQAAVILARFLRRRERVAPTRTPDR